MRTAPGWVAQIEFAKQMHKAPWEIFPGRPILWWHRWKAMHDLLMEKAAKEKNNGLSR